MTPLQPTSIVDPAFREEKIRDLARHMLVGAIDYAGLFPPAALEMPAVVANYAAYRISSRGWALGRLVIPLSRLAEFEAQFALLEISAVPSWRIAALGGADPAADAAAIADFNRRLAGGAQIDALEAPVQSENEIAARAALCIPAGLAFYGEVTLTAETQDLLVALHRHQVRAKVRTGGAVVPSESALLSFLQKCVEIGLPFKATAGLHHAFPARGHSAAGPDTSGQVYGYANLMLATAALPAGRDPAPEVRRRDGFGIVCNPAEMDAARRLFLGFGSCSFTEPLDQAGLD